MKRPMCVIGFPFGAAMLLAFLFDAKTALLLSVAVVLTGTLALIAGRRIIPIQICVAILSAGMAFGVYAAYHYREIAPFERAGGNILTIEGIVTDVKISSRAIDYTISARFPKVNLPDTVIRLRAYGEVAAGIGDTIRCRAEIAEGGAGRADGVLKATRKSDFSFIEAAKSDIFELWRLGTREYLKRCLFSKIQGENAVVLGTMTLNTGGDISSEIYAHMNRSGISHILSISGMHFSVISTFVLLILRKARLPRRVPELLTILFGIFFTILAGFSSPIVRSFIMFALVISGGLFRRRADSVNSLGFAVLLISAIWPRWTQSLGMWLSAFSTLGILIAGRKISDFLYDKLGDTGKESRILRMIAASGGISAGAYAFTLPLLMLKTGWISLVAPLTNILTAPFATPAMICGLICSVVPGNPLPIRIAAIIAEYCTKAMLRISEIMASLPFSIIAIDEAYILICLVGAVMVAIILLIYKPKGAAAVCAMLCTIILCAGNISAVAAGQDKIELVTLEGCSSAILIHGNEAVLLGVPDKYEAGSVERYLDYRGLDSISCIFAGNVGDNLDSGLIRIASERKPLAIIGPNDAYVSGQLAQAVKGVPVYPGGYSYTEVLGGAVVAMDTKGRIKAQIGNITIEKIERPYSPSGIDNRQIYIYNDGELFLPDDIAPVIEPVGAGIYGETRIYLKAV